MMKRELHVRMAKSVGKRLLVAVTVLSVFAVWVMLHDELCRFCQWKTEWQRFVRSNYSELQNAETWKALFINQVWAGALLSVIMAPLMSYAWNKGTWYFQVKRPARRLWGLNDSSTCRIIISCTSNLVRMYKYGINTTHQSLNGGLRKSLSRFFARLMPGPKFVQRRYNTGEGQVKALPYLIASLRDAYGDSFDWANLELSMDSVIAPETVGRNCDVILVGGPVTNRHAAGLLKRLVPRLSVKIDEDGVIIENKEAKLRSHYGVTRETVAPQSGKREGHVYVKREYALVVRLTNTDGPKKTRMILLAGCTTHGTICAARFFCEQASAHPDVIHAGKRDYIAVIAAEHDIPNRVFSTPELKCIYILDEKSVEVH